MSKQGPFPPGLSLPFSLGHRKGLLKGPPLAWQRDRVQAPLWAQPALSSPFMGGGGAASTPFVVSRPFGIDLILACFEVGWRGDTYSPRASRRDVDRTLLPLVLHTGDLQKTNKQTRKCVRLSFGDR